MNTFVITWGNWLVITSDICIAKYTIYWLMFCKFFYQKEALIYFAIVINSITQVIAPCLVPPSYHLFSSLSIFSLTLLHSHCPSTVSSNPEPSLLSLQCLRRPVSAFQRACDRWDTHACGRHTSDRFHVHTGRSCSSVGPDTRDTLSVVKT